MRFLAVDDEPLMLNGLVSAIQLVRPEAEILSFTKPEEALEAAKQMLNTDGAYVLVCNVSPENPSK